MEEADAAQLVAEEGEFDTLAIEIALDRIRWLTSDRRLGEARQGQTRLSCEREPRTADTLAAVLGFATELADSWDGFEPEEARSLVRLIAKQSADISSIVDDLLTITRVEAGTMSIHPKALDALEHVGPLVETLAREENRPVPWQGNALVWADPTRLRQVVRNLVSNAFRYGGDIVRVEVSQEEALAHIEIHDSGGPYPRRGRQRCSSLSTISTTVAELPTPSASDWR